MGIKLEDIFIKLMSRRGSHQLRPLLIAVTNRDGQFLQARTQSSMAGKPGFDDRSSLRRTANDSTVESAQQYINSHVHSSSRTLQAGVSSCCRPLHSSVLPINAF